MADYITSNQAEMQRKRGRPSKRIEAESEPAPKSEPMPDPTPTPAEDEGEQKVWLKVRANYNPHAGTVYLNADGGKEVFPNFAPSDAGECFRRRLKPGTLVLLPLAEARRLLNADHGAYAEMWVPGT